ncbi:MAG: hypothetical protein PHY56_00250 [Candidatus Omnitrophica bacterium]|nr:hypothetical protein [Candidatus Omnitrophota bacterium]
MANESKFSGQVRKCIEAQLPGAWARKIPGNPYGAGGLPDIVGIWNRGFGIECKLTDKLPVRDDTNIDFSPVTDLQKFNLAMIEKAQGKSFFLICIEWRYAVWLPYKSFASLNFKITKKQLLALAAMPELYVKRSGESWDMSWLKFQLK